MVEKGDVAGIWIGDRDVSMVEEFDETFECGPNYAGSRSDELKEAMRLAIAVRQTVDEFGYDIEGPPLRHHVQQALLEKDRREAAWDAADE